MLQHTYKMLDNGCTSIDINTLAEEADFLSQHHIAGMAWTENTQACCRKYF
jgi:hypothetical protein